MGLLKYLLDTQCWLWSRGEPDRLPSPLRRRFREHPDQLVLSSVCAIEIGVKHARGRLKLDVTPESLLQRIVEDGVEELPIGRNHALKSASLPHHHGDPFDRLLVAQAMLEGLTLVTADPLILRYGVQSIDARK